MSISNLLAAFILFLGFAAIIKATGVKNDAALALGITDCTAYTFAFSGDPVWGSDNALNITGMSDRV